MGWIDQVPGCGKLYIGGFHALRRYDELKDLGVTHVVSVLRWPIEEELVKPYKHLQIEVDDDEDENLLESFAPCNRFIEDALNAGGGVFVHCAMGKSRSATIVIAHMMAKYHMDPQSALAQLRESRGVCEPNEGFMKQLELYHQMSCPVDVETDPAYQRWLYQRELDAARAAGIAPDAERIRFEDEHMSEGTNVPGSAAAAASSLNATEAVTKGAASKPDFELKCKKCRRTLATSGYLLPSTAHSPAQLPGRYRSLPKPPSACSHFFLEPLSWMRPELEQGLLEGRLECPNEKCKTNVGKYAWQGMRCSCGGWVVPGISLAKSRLDEVVAKAKASAADGKSQDMGIRRPPGGGGGGGGNNGNL